AGAQPRASTAAAIRAESSVIGLAARSPAAANAGSVPGPSPYVPSRSDQPAARTSAASVSAAGSGPPSGPASAAQTDPSRSATNAGPRPSAQPSPRCRQLYGSSQL